MDIQITTSRFAIVLDNSVVYITMQPVKQLPTTAYVNVSASCSIVQSDSLSGCYQYCIANGISGFETLLARRYKTTTEAIVQMLSSGS
jgi:hypothetical protein